MAEQEASFFWLAETADVLKNRFNIEAIFKGTIPVVTKILVSNKIIRIGRLLVKFFWY